MDKHTWVLSDGTIIVNGIVNGVTLRQCPDCGEFNVGYYDDDDSRWWWCKACHVGSLLFPDGTFDNYGEQLGATPPESGGA